MLVVKWWVIIQDNREQTHTTYRTQTFLYPGSYMSWTLKIRTIFQQFIEMEWKLFYYYCYFQFKWENSRKFRRRFCQVSHIIEWNKKINKYKQLIVALFHLKTRMNLHTRNIHWIWDKLSERIIPDLPRNQWECPYSIQ